MKKKLPVDQQAALLTTEQKKTVPKLFWVQIIALIVAFIVVVGSFAAWFAAHQKAAQLKDRYYAAAADGDSILASSEKLWAWFDASEKADTIADVTIIACIALFLIFLVMAIYIAKKYPYYSEKLYFYLRKHK